MPGRAQTCEPYQYARYASSFGPRSVYVIYDPMASASLMVFRPMVESVTEGNIGHVANVFNRDNTIDSSIFFSNCLLGFLE